MEERDSREPETVASSPASPHTAPNGSKTSKDRQCSFCGQAFTSSSLGRHLDLYIKPKNPKPPDGVHNVDEIRKMRGRITRRQPKSNLKNGANVNPSGWLKQPGSAEGTPRRASSNTGGAGEGPNGTAAGSPLESPGTAQDAGGKTNNLAAYRLTPATSWQATGIITDLPPKAQSQSRPAAPTGQAQRMQEMRRATPAGDRIPRPEHESESTWKLLESAEVGRAAELALREVLSSLQATKEQERPRQLFDGVDFTSLSFPALCLAIMPAPATLFSSTPFPSGDSWTLSPPGVKQFETLNRLINQRVTSLQQEDVSRFTNAQAFIHHAHMHGAYDQWQQLPEPEKASIWTLETLRAYAKMQKRSSAAKQELEAANSRIRHLETEFDRLSRCQLPREYLLYPPNTMPVSTEAVRELNKARLQSGASAVDYDADALIRKWRSAVRATKRRSDLSSEDIRDAGMADFRKNASAKTASQRLRGDMVLNGAFFNVHDSRSRDSPEAPRYDPSHIEYETPPYPGAVLDDEDNPDADADADADADGPANYNNFGNAGSHADRTTSAKQRRPTDDPGYAHDVSGLVNTNGKRPLAPTASYGRSGARRV